MKDYIDGFAFPILESQLNLYKEIVQDVALIWKSYGAISYKEYVSNELSIEGTLSFKDLLEANENECIIFGWLVFESKKVRDLAHEAVAKDPKMHQIVAPLFDENHPIFKPERMAFGGFSGFI